MATDERKLCADGIVLPAVMAMERSAAVHRAVLSGMHHRVGTCVLARSRRRMEGAGPGSNGFLAVGENYFQDTRPGSLGECGQRFREREAAGDHRVYVDLMLPQQFDRGSKATAARSHEGDFINDHGRGIERYFAMNSRFENDRSARASHAYCLPETGSGTSRFDNKGIFRGWRIIRNANARAGAAGDFELAFMMAKYCNVRSMRAKSLGNEEAKLTIAEQRYFGAGCDRNLIEDFACRGEWLNEYRFLVRDLFGNRIEIAFGQGQIFGESAGMFYDAEHRAIQAVPAEANGAKFAMAAGKINFADHTLVGCNHQTRKFVARNATKSVVAALKLQVGIADTRAQHADQCKSERACGKGHAS